MQEHPFLHRPWFMLHPCQTAANMQLLTEQQRGAEPASAAAVAVPAAAVASAAEPAMQTKRAGTGEHAAAAARAEHSQAGRPCSLRYLLAWLSVVGQPLGIRVPPDLWQCCL